MVLARLKELIPLAPLHQPYALQAIEALQVQRPNLLQVACFDTAFHATRSPREQHLALPRALATRSAATGSTACPMSTSPVYCRQAWLKRQTARW